MTIKCELNIRMFKNQKMIIPKNLSVLNVIVVNGFFTSEIKFLSYFYDSFGTGKYLTRQLKFLHHE